MDKPPGPTSHDVVARVRRALGTRAVGHTGTLDPFATGLLVILVGGATRLARFLEADLKTYRATARLGVTTDTDDATGALMARMEPERWPDRQAITEVMGRLLGSQLQVPPAYSAKRVAGRRSYQLARAGKPVMPAAATVTVQSLDCLGWQPPMLEFRAVVSTGTYVRSLARDLGDLLGVGAHLTALRREAIGTWRVEDASALDGVLPGTPLIAPADLLAAMPAVEVEAAEAIGVSHGRLVPRASAEGRARLMREGVLLAVAEATPGGWQPVVVLEGA